MKGKQTALIAVTGIILLLIVSCSEKTTEPKPTVATPTFSLPEGTYTGPQEIEILCATEDARITYTTDESTPEPTSALYTEPLLIAEPTTLKARAFKDGWQDSEVKSAVYLITDADSTVATPTFSPPCGRYKEPQKVEIFCATEGAIIFYSITPIDDYQTMPRAGIYSEPLLIDKSCRISAVALKAGWQESKRAIGIYRITVPDSLKFSISMTASPDTIYAGMYSDIYIRVRDNDEFPVPFVSVRFRVAIGQITSEVVTNEMGIAKARYYSDEQFEGVVTIEASINFTVVTTNITILPVSKVHSLHIPEGPFYIDVGGGGVEERIIPVQLRDSQGELVLGEHTVTFEITDWPGKDDPDENPADRPSINQRGLSDAVRTENGNGIATFYAPKRAGKSTVRATYRKEDNTQIVSNNLDIHARPDSPATIELSAGGINSAVNMGGGMWRIEVKALVKDRNGNEVIHGTVVHFSLAEDPPPPNDTSITVAAYVGNAGDDNEDGLPGVAHTHLFYHGKDTNREIRIVARSGDTFGHLQFKLPLQYPEFSIGTEPQKIEFYSAEGGAGTDPLFIDAEIIAVVKDGQGSYIAGEEILLQSPGSFRYHPSVVPNPPEQGTPEYRPEYIYTLDGPVGDLQFGEKGHAYGIIRVSGNSVPHPGDEEFSKTDIQISAMLVSTNQIAVTRLTAIRWLRERRF